MFSMNQSRASFLLGHVSSRQETFFTGIISVKIIIVFIVKNLPLFMPLLFQEAKKNPILCQSNPSKLFPSPRHIAKCFFIY